LASTDSAYNDCGIKDDNWKDTEIGYLPHSTHADTLFSNNLLKSFYSSSRKYFSDKRQFRQAFIRH
jgi:hypothetical protein